MSVTDEDRERAARLLWAAALEGGTGRAVEEVAAALAAEREKARAPFERLFSGNPDTACRTTWRPNESRPNCSAASIECVEVSMDDLRAAFDSQP